MKSSIRFFIGAMLLNMAGMVMAQLAVIQSVGGDAQMQNGAGVSTPLVQGQALAAGSQLVTGENGQAVVRFSDGHIVALKGSSTVKIAAYVYDQQQPAASSFVMELLRGGLRSITGLLGKANPQAFRLITPTATIGIRGSDWMAALQNNGLYTGVNSGGIAVNNAANSLLVDAGQYSATLAGTSGSQLLAFSQLPAGIFGSLPQLSLAGVGATGPAGVSGPAGAANAMSAGIGGIAPGTLVVGAALAAAVVVSASSSTGTVGTTGTTGTAQ